MREGFSARIETVNTMEAWLGSLPGHTVPNVRRPMIHTGNLADLLPLAGVWTGRDENPCPSTRRVRRRCCTAPRPARRRSGSICTVGDVGHTLIFGPTGAGKSVLLCTVALQALRYPGVTICAFDKGRSMWATVRACGGRHYDVAGESAGPTFCPLAVLETEADTGLGGRLDRDLLRTADRPAARDRPSARRSIGQCYCCARPTTGP